MKRQLILFLLILCIVAPLCAQKGLQVNSLFGGRYKNREDATEVLLKGLKISGYGLSLFRSLTLPGNTQEARRVEQLVRADAATAIDKETGLKGGRLYYGFYRFRSNGRTNRYLFYRNNTLHTGGNPTMTLIYMEGTATIDDLKRAFGK